MLPLSRDSRQRALGSSHRAPSASRGLGQAGVLAVSGGGLGELGLPGSWECLCEASSRGVRGPSGPSSWPSSVLRPLARWSQGTQVDPVAEKQLRPECQLALLPEASGGQLPLPPGAALSAVPWPAASCSQLAALRGGVCRQFTTELILKGLWASALPCPGGSVCGRGVQGVRPGGGREKEGLTG